VQCSTRLLYWYRYGAKWNESRQTQTVYCDAANLIFGSYCSTLLATTLVISPTPRTNFDPSWNSIMATTVLLCPLGLKGRRFLKTRNRALPPQTCTFGYPGMSGQSAYKVVCGVYLKKIHQVLVEQQENFRRFRVISRKSCLAHVQGGKL